MLMKVKIQCYSRCESAKKKPSQRYRAKQLGSAMPRHQHCQFVSLGIVQDQSQVMQSLLHPCKPVYDVYAPSRIIKLPSVTLHPLAIYVDAAGTEHVLRTHVALYQYRKDRCANYNTRLTAT